MYYFFNYKNQYINYLKLKIKLTDWLLTKRLLTDWLGELLFIYLCQPK